MDTRIHSIHSHAKKGGAGSSQPTIDPTQIQGSAGIPPAGADYTGLSQQGQVDVYSGTLPGDIDASPAAKELLSTAPDTGGLSNADYVYNQLSKLYGGTQLPGFQSPNGNNVKNVVFVSGSTQGPFGAFHIQDADQAGFDRIVVDSLTASGNYSPGSGLNASQSSSTRGNTPFNLYMGPGNLLDVTNVRDPRLKQATKKNLLAAIPMAGENARALSAYKETRNPYVLPSGQVTHVSRSLSKQQLAKILVAANQNAQRLLKTVASANPGRQYLSSALFAAEATESFETQANTSLPGQTDGEALSRVLAFKLTPEIALVSGFNGAVTQQWWKDGHPDWVNDNSQNDQSTDGNASGVMFLEYLNDYLGIPMDDIIKNMPQGGGALGQTYAGLVKEHPELAQSAGADGKAAFQSMINVLQQNAQNSDGTLNLPANGNPFPALPGAKSGGLFSGQASGGNGTNGTNTSADAQAAAQGIGNDLNDAQQKLARLQTLAQSFGTSGSGKDSYGPPLPTSTVQQLQQQAAPYLDPQDDAALQQTFWPHVYNELPGSGTNTYRLQVITGTNDQPNCVQVSGTIKQTKLEPDGDMHITFTPDDPKFPSNADGNLEVEVIYAGPVSQADAKQAEQGYTNPFDISQLTPNTHIQIAGPLIYDTAHGKVDAGGNITEGLEIHPVANLNILPAGQGGSGATGNGGTSSGNGATGNGGSNTGNTSGASQVQALSQKLGSDLTDAQQQLARIMTLLQSSN